MPEHKHSYMTRDITFLILAFVICLSSCDFPNTPSHTDHTSTHIHFTSHWTDTAFSIALFLFEAFESSPPLLVDRTAV